MKTPIFILPIILGTAMISITSCNNSTSSEQVQKIKDLARQDSTRAVQANQKDSLITAYLGDLNEIQDNLDQIKEREKIITMKPAEMKSDDKQSVVEEVKELDDWILNNDKKMNSLRARLGKMDTKNTKLENLVEHLTKETAEKDEEIAALQAQLGKANDSLRLITARFNDSIFVIKKQRIEMAAMNTVYYVTGTLKELKEKGIIDKEGGFIGLGRVAQLNPQANTSMFVKANATSLKGISLPGKFRRFITTHPDKTYQVISNAKSDSIVITMPSTFWSESKYLVVAVK